MANLWLASHAVALSLDVHSTDYALKHCPPGYVCREANPNPLMKSTGGRLAMAAAEATVLEVVRRKHKKTGRVITGLSIGLHGFLGFKNYRGGFRPGPRR